MEKTYVAFLVDDYGDRVAHYSSTDENKVLEFLKKHVCETFPADEVDWGLEQIDKYGGVDEDCYYEEYPLGTEF